MDELRKRLVMAPNIDPAAGQKAAMDQEARVRSAVWAARNEEVERHGRPVMYRCWQKERAMDRGELRPLRMNKGRREKDNGEERGGMWAEGRSPAWPSAAAGGLPWVWNRVGGHLSRVRHRGEIGDRLSSESFFYMWTVG